LGRLKLEYGNRKLYDESNDFVIKVDYLSNRIVITHYVLSTLNMGFDTAKSKHIIQSQYKLKSGKVIARRGSSAPSSKFKPYVSTNDLKYNEYKECSPSSIEEATEEYSIILPKNIQSVILENSSGLLREALSQDSIMAKR